eukprot:8247254-Pyramimonas_sp.AAC.1
MKAAMDVSWHARPVSRMSLLCSLIGGVRMGIFVAVPSHPDMRPLFMVIVLPTPHCVVFDKVTPQCRPVSSIDADDLVSFRQTCSILFRKAATIYTNFRIYDACYGCHIAHQSVRLKWFSVDYESRFSDTR